jgi:hypothetical protein
VSDKRNKVVDGKRKTPHNLISLLLTNKTIRSAAPKGAEAEKVL